MQWVQSRNLGVWKGILCFLSNNVIVSTEILLSLLITTFFRAVKIEKVKKKITELFENRWQWKSQWISVLILDGTLSVFKVSCLLSLQKATLEVQPSTVLWIWHMGHCMTLHIMWSRSVQENKYTLLCTTQRKLFQRSIAKKPIQHIKRRLRNYLITAYVFLRRKALINKGLFSLEEKGKSSKNQWKLKPGKFNLRKRHKYQRVRVINHWKKIISV